MDDKLKCKIIDEYKNNGKSLTQISKDTGISRWTITNIVKSEGIEVTRLNNRIFYFDHNFFKHIDNEYKAYWLGFIYADGCVSKSLHATIIGLSSRDKNHLFKLIDCISGNGLRVIDRVVTVNGREYQESRLNLCSNEFCKSLMDKGVVPGKTRSTIYPSIQAIPDKLKRHFLRGYFDGDGCVTISDTAIHHVNIASSNKDMLDDIKQYLEANDIVCDITVSKQGCHYLHVRKQSQKSIFLHLLYSNCNIYLDRKYNKYVTAASCRNTGVNKRAKSVKVQLDPAEVSNQITNG